MMNVGGMRVPMGDRIVAVSVRMRFGDCSLVCVTVVLIMNM